MSYLRRLYQTGGRAPITVTNPNDPRLKAYNDSLTLYNNTLPIRDFISKNKHFTDKDLDDMLSKTEATSAIRIGTRSAYRNLGYPEPELELKGSNGDYMRAFKKPVQPIIYQKPQQAPIKKGQPTPYNDSLTLYNATKDDISKIKSLSPEDWWNYVGDWNKKHPEAQAAGDRLKKLNGKAPSFVQTYSPQYREGNIAGIYKKPVGTPQPQEPKFKRPIGQEHNYPVINEGTGRPIPTIPNLQRADYDMSKPTKFAFTYPDYSQSGIDKQQKSLYFPDLGTLRAFSKGYGKDPSHGGDQSWGQTLYEGNIENKKRGGMKKYQLGGLEPTIDMQKLQEILRQHLQGPIIQDPNQTQAVPQLDTGIGATAGDPVTAQQSAQIRKGINPLTPNNFGLGVMGAYVGSSYLLNKSNDRNYEAYKQRWIRDYSIPSLLQDPTKHGDVMYESPIYASGGIHIKPENRGKFNATKKRTGKTTEELTHSSNPVTRKRAIFAQNAKKWKHQDGGMTLNTPEDQALGYYGYPNASSLHFPGQGERTFVPGPFPLLVKDQNGTQMLNKKAIKTRGPVTEIPMFKEGGEVRNYAVKVAKKDATIEAEQGELIFGAGAQGTLEDQKDRVGAGLYRVGGKKHYEGGTPLKAHEGDFVFSNDKDLAFSEETAKDLTGDKVTKVKMRTPAKLAEKYMDLNKFITMTQDKDVDPLTKKTAIFNINNYIDRLAEIAYAQEEKKGFPNGLPAFASASLDTRGFDTQSLQGQLNAYKYGGEVKKYQVGGLTQEVRDKAKKVDKAPQNYQLIGNYGNKTYYKDENGNLVEAPQAVSGKRSPLQGTDYVNWLWNVRPDLHQYSSDQLIDKGFGAPGDAWKAWKYVPKEDYVYTEGSQTGDLDRTRPNFSPIDGPTPHAPTFDNLSPQTPLTNYTSVPNNKFDVNAAEALGLTAAVMPSKSRYPTAFRNYEIQNAKSQISNAYRPISEQPYLNAIRRQSLGFDQNNNSYGAAGFTRSLGAFNASLGAQDQAISTVYSQNLSRRDQAANALASLEVQDGTDRINNFEKYDTKLETLANNKELEGKYRMANLNAVVNQMQRDRESKGLFNTMSDYYQINKDNTLGMKPTYKIENGKVVLAPRNMADLIRQSGQTQNTAYMNTLENIFKMMQRYGVSSSGFIDDIMKQAIRPQ